jgi:hypothetical protein
MIAGLADFTKSMRRSTFGTMRVPAHSIKFGDVPVEHEREKSTTRAPTLAPTT